MISAVDARIVGSWSMNFLGIHGIFGSRCTNFTGIHGASGS